MGFGYKLVSLLAVVVGNVFTPISGKWEEFIVLRIAKSVDSSLLRQNQKLYNV